MDKALEKGLISLVLLSFWYFLLNSEKNYLLELGGSVNVCVDLS
jgi:hypothetical protein